MLHCDKAPARATFRRYLQHRESGEETVGGKVLAPVPILGFNLKNVGYMLVAASKTAQPPRPLQDNIIGNPIMTEIRHFAGWLRGRLRAIASLVAVAGTLVLTGCGGGSGAPNNFFDQFMTVTPSTAVAYSGVPATLNINGGSGQFQVTSSNAAVLPVSVSGRSVVLLANSVAADTAVNVTVKDVGPLINQTEITVPVTVRPAPLLNSFTITPNLEDCGAALCSGQTATASVTVRGPEGGLLAGRAVRFDVIGSSYAIVTNNPAQPLTNSLTVVSDSTGTAAVVIQANTNAPTQVAQMSVTDLTSGQTLVGNFTIVQITDGAAILTVVPDTVTINGAFVDECSSGFATDYYIYGGTPPYRVSSTFPQGITLVNSIVNTNGGFFRAITNGACVDPLVFTIVDATGRQTTAELENVPGTATRPAPTPPSALVVTPTAITSTTCTNNTFRFVVVGGTPPYNVTTSPAGATVNPQTISGSGTNNFTDISGLTTGSGATAVIFVDSSSPKKSLTATITCS